MPPIPLQRIVALNDALVAPSRDMVLYWQTAARRTRYNFALEHAIAHARTLDKPLVVLGALRVDYPWASDRLHSFALDGLADNAAAYAAAKVRHYCYVESASGKGRGLLEALARHACVVVTDDYPEFFLPRMARAAADKLAAFGVRLEAVDGNGLIPMRATDKAHVYAHQFRRHVQRVAHDHLSNTPAPAPLRGARALPQPAAELDRALAAIERRWPAADPAAFDVASLPVDHDVPAVAQRGGERAARAALRSFMERRYDRYATDRNDVNAGATSRLSPFLHWGFVSAHELFAKIAERERWTPERTASRPTGKREGWWGMSVNGEAFLEQLITWRELGFNGALFIPDHDSFDSLPPWARVTLSLHDADARPNATTLDVLERGESYDEVWNEAQRQLRVEGRIENYLRMLWGKKILEWAPGPRDALAWMLHLNNKWALDGRDPNSTSGIAWVMGRYDRPWGPERAIFGKVRYMTTRKKGLGARC